MPPWPPMVSTASPGAADELPGSGVADEPPSGAEEEPLSPAPLPVMPPYI